MVIAEEPITAIIPARPIAHGNRYSEEPVLEVKHKTSSRHEKRTKRDSYKYSGDSNQPPIEYVYTYSEETPKRSADPDGGKTSTDLVLINGNGPGKIECTVGEDGNLVVKIRGKPDSVPLDPDKLPIVLPEGWQLKEIQTNQRSRKTERSRKTRIKDEIFVSGEESEKALVLYNEHTHAVNGHESVHDEFEDRNYGHADEEEYTHGEHNGSTYVHKKSRKYEEGPAGLTSRIEESHTEEGVDFDHPNNKQRSSKSTHSLLERTENSKRKFSKQSVTDEKVTETHKSNVRYFDADSSSASGLRQDLRDHTTNIQSTEQNYYGRSDTTRGRTDEQRDHDIIIESPEDTPYNSLDRRDRRHHHNEEEIIDIDDRYRYHDDDYNTREDTRTDRRVETSGYVASYRAPRDQRTETERPTERTEEEYSLYKDQNGRSVNGGPHSDRYDEITDRRETEERTYYDKRRRTSDTSDVSSRRGQNQLNGYPSGTNIHENIERTNVTERYRYGTPDRPVNNPTSRTDIEEREDRALLIENRRNGYPERQPQNWSTRTDREEREERTSVTGSYRPLYPDRQPDTRTTRTDTEEREEKTSVTGSYRPFYPDRQPDIQTTRTDTEEREERTSVTGSYRPYRPSSETITTRKEEREERYLDEEFPDSVSVLQQPVNRTDLATRTDREDKEERTSVVESYRNGYPERQPVPNRPVNYSTRSDKEDREERTTITGTYRPLPQQNVYPASTDDRLDTTRVEKEERIDVYGNLPSQSQPEQRTVPYRPDYNQDTTTRTDQYEERVDVTKNYDQPRTQRVPLDNRVDQTSTTTERREDYFINNERPLEHRPVLVDRREDREERREEIAERHLYDIPTNRPLTTVSRAHNEEAHKEVRDFPGPRVYQPHHEEERFAEKVEQEVFRSPSEVRRQPTLHNNTSTTTTTKRSEIVDKYLDLSEGIGPSTHQHLPDSRTQHFSQSTELTHLRDTRQESPHFKPVDEHQTSSATRHDTLATQVDIMDEGKSSPQSRDRKGAKDRVTIDDRYRVIGSSEERPGPTAHHHRPLVTDQRTDKSTYQRKDTTKEVEERRTHSRLTDISSTGERIVPVGIGPTPARPNDSRRDSAVSSVDLSEIKPGEHLDNRALKDRGNLAQNGSLGQRRPPSRNPVKFPHFGDENAVPEDFLSTSDTTLPTPLRPSQQRPQQPTSGRFSTVSDAGTMIDKSHTSSTTRQQTMRDERVLINYTDKTDKPDWVRNIDDHFSNRRNVNIHYARENVTSPTPRIEEIATIAGSTVITVNGEDKPVHGIVTEPGDRPLLSFAQPIEKDVVHQSEKGSRSGFTRVTESKGYKQSAKEHVQYQERRENVRQISVSYDIPGKGKHIREYTWAGQQEKPDEKITFQEERRHTKDVNMVLGLDQPRPYVPPAQTTTETTRTVDRQEKIVFAEERPQPARDVSVNIGLQEDVRKMEVTRRPIEANTFRFEEERKHERQVDMVVGLNEDVYYEPLPQEKIVFQEEREVKKDVSVTLGLEDYETAPPFEPLPVEKFTFEETRVIPAHHDVALIFGIDEPLSQPPVLIPPRPISTPSESTVVTQPIVPQYVKPREETKKFERIVEERREDTRLTAQTDIIPPTPQPPRVVHERVQEVEKFEEYIINREQPRVIHERVQEVEKAEEYVIHREQPKVVAKAEVIPPSAKIIAATEILPPPPRTVSMTAAIDSAAVYHDEVGLVPEEPHIFETSVALQGRQKRERVEQLLQMEKPPPAPLPPTSGRVEKHVHLETIVPEPTGEPLPQSLGLYGYTYKATIEPKKPEFEPSIEFHVVESERPVETIEETVEKIDWYIKEGKAPSEISDDVSSIGEVRAATPPRHPELTATAEIVPPTHVVASAEITPPGPRQAKVAKQTHLSASAEIVPPKKQKPLTVEEIPTFHYGEDQEDRLSLISGSWEEQEKPQPQRPNVTKQPFETLSTAKVEDRKLKSPEKVETIIRQPPPPPPKRNQRNDFSRAPKGQADRTELSEIHFDTPEEEERWKSSLQRHAIPQPKRAQQDLQLERPREETARPLPKPSGRIPRKTWSEKLDTEHAGHLQKALGTYGYLYTATLNPQAVVPHGLPLDVEQIDTTETKIDLDVQQALLTAFAEIIPPLTPKQQHQLLIASVEIFPPLTAEQQRSLLNALVMIHPALTIDQQRQLLEGKEITPPLTVEQQQQLATISADIVPGLTPKQHKQLLYATLQITPPLTEDQQEQLLIAVAEIFPPPPPRKRVKILDRDELSEEEEDEVDYLIKARRKQEEKKRAEERRKTVERYEKTEEEEIDVDYLLKTGREQENKRTKGRINDRGIWEKTFESETVERTETSFMEEARKKFDKKEEQAEWIEKTRHLQTGETSHDRSELSYGRNERHVVHGKYDETGRSSATGLVDIAAYSDRLRASSRSPYQGLPSERDIHGQSGWFTDSESDESGEEDNYFSYAEVKASARLSRTDPRRLSVDFGRIVSPPLMPSGTKERVWFRRIMSPERSINYSEYINSVVNQREEPEDRKDFRSLASVAPEVACRSLLRAADLDFVWNNDERRNKTEDFWNEYDKLQQPWFLGVATYEDRLREVDRYKKLLDKRANGLGGATDDDFDSEVLSEDSDRRKIRPFQSAGVRGGFLGTATYEERLEVSNFTRYANLVPEFADPDSDLTFDKGDSADDEEEELSFSRDWEENNILITTENERKILENNHALNDIVEHRSGSALRGVISPVTPTFPTQPLSPVQVEELKSEIFLRRSLRLQKEEARKVQRSLLSPSLKRKYQEELEEAEGGRIDMTAGLLYRTEVIAEQRRRYFMDLPPVQYTEYVRIPTLVEPFLARTYPRDKEVSLQQKRYLSEQTTHLEDDAADLEVSAINMNIKPRIKSQTLLMAPSPPLPRPYSPATGSGFRYTASPQISTPPMTDTSGFMYEAIVDGHGSPMSQELGRYGFTYQATLDGSETYRKMAESTHQLEINQIESRRQESSSTSPDTPKRLSTTPPWSTPPITPIPAPAPTPPRDTTSRDNTPLPGVRDLGSTSSAWKKTDWGRSVYEKNVETTGTRKPLQPIEASFPVGSAHRHELRGNVYSPDEEIHERITENVIRRRQEMDSSYEESQRIAEETSKWLEKTTVARPPTDVKEPPANWKCEYPIVEEPGSDAGRPPGQDIMEETRMTLTETITRRHGELTVPRGTDPSLIPAMFEVAEAEDELKRRTEAMKMGSSNKTTTSKTTSDQGSNYRGDTKTETYTRTNTSRDDKQTSQNKSNIPPGKTSPQADGRPASSASQYSNVSDRSFGSSASQNKFRTTSREERFDQQHETTIKKKEERTEKIVSFADEHKSDQTVPEWVRLVEERKRRSEPQQQYFRSDKYAKKEPAQSKARQLAELPEEDPLEAALERIATDRRATQQPDSSPSSLRKWGNVGALSSAATTSTSSKNDSSFNKGFRKHTTETKEVIEESRFHSEQAMLEAIESASAGNSNLLSTMSQSMPSLAHTRRMEGSGFGDITRSNDDMVLSMEELSRSNTKLKRSDGAEEEVKDFSFARRGDTVSPETKRTKRTVVRKLVNGEWKEVAVREEDMPAEDMAMELHAAQPTDRILAQLQHRDEDKWSLSDAVIEETTTTRTIRRVEEEEEDIISLAGTDA